MARPVALTMPAVTLFSNVNGEPMASTHSPGRSFDGSPSLHDGKLLAFDLEHGDVGARVEADDLRRIFAAVGHAHRDFIRVRDDVRVGEDVAVGADDEARAFALTRCGCLVARRPCGPFGMPKRRKNSWTGSSAVPSPRGLAARAARLLDHRHVDDRGTHLLDERGEIRQHAAIQRADRLRGRRLLGGHGDWAPAGSELAPAAATEDWGEQAPTAMATTATHAKASRNE